MIPSPIEVLPRLLSGTGLATAMGGLTCGFSVGRAPKVSMNLTEPVGIPCPEAPATSARTNTTEPNAIEVPFGIGLPFESMLEMVVVLLSGVTVTCTAGEESLGANAPVAVDVEFPA